LFDVGVNATRSALSNIEFLNNLAEFTNATNSTAGNLTEQTRSLFEEYAIRVLNQQPTIIVEPGTSANLFVNRDMILPAFFR
jgi:type IV secretory pathway VirB10-like protein